MWIRELETVVQNVAYDLEFLLIVSRPYES